jgi:hypothetical protein
MGLLNSKDELAFKGGNIKTEDISSTIPYMKNLDLQAKKLVNHLDYKINYNNKSLVLFNETENFDMYKLFEKSKQTNHNNNFSETSPFISSDVYNQLLDNLKNKQSGGAKHKTKKHQKSESSYKKNKKHQKSESSYTKTNEDRDEEESSTSSESSSENQFDSDNYSEKKSSFVKKVKKHNRNEEEMNIEPDEDEDEDFSPMSLGMTVGSYVSSSAHSDNVSSAVSSEESSDNALTMNSSTVSVKNHKNRHNYSESVNTSDINIISVDE